MQFVMYKIKLETRQELLVITLFHLLGLSMELFKVAHGSWAYPEFAYSKIANVPLYSGFMYASVASYMCQAWRRFDLKLMQWPKPLWAWTVAVATYLNFFTHHYIEDLRWWLVGIILLTFFQSKVQFSVNKKKYSMPVAVSFVLIGFFIWLAENIATYFDAWKYAHQIESWSPVHLQKISSWALMVIISYIIVAQLQLHSHQESTQTKNEKLLF